MHEINTINSLELKFYGVVWISAVLYSIYNFSKSSSEYFRDYHDEFSDFARGWPILNRKSDISDYEWESLKYLIKKLYPWALASIAISEILRKYKKFAIIPYWQILITFSCILNEFGLVPLVAMTLQPVVFFTASVLSEKKKSVIWILCGVILSLSTLEKKYNYIEEMINNRRISYVTVITVFWMNLRCLSYTLDHCNARNHMTFIGFLSYCSYLPVFFTGPFISYENFKESQKIDTSSQFTKKVTGICLNFIRFFFWLYFGEVFLHFLYVNATQFHPDWVASLEPWSLYGYGYAMGQFFHIKYVIYYGLTTSLAKFDGIITPTLPICIGRVHLYSDMWRYFDSGLYEFLVKYIYVPTIGNRYVKSRLWSSFLCFAFVYIWHGTETYILIWSTFNYLGVVLESLASGLYENRMKQSAVIRNLGPRWTRRAICASSTLLLAFSAISNFYFFARTDIGNVFLVRFLTDSWSSTFMLLAILYTCCQVSTELRLRRSSNKNTKMEEK